MSEINGYIGLRLPQKQAAVRLCDETDGGCTETGCKYKITAGMGALSRRTGNPAPKEGG